MSASDFGRYVGAETRKWAKVIDMAGAKPE
jgi:hypothetical protein